VAYIGSLLLLALLFFAMHYFTELAKMHKITITAALFVIIYSAIAYNTYKNEQRQKLLKTIVKYEQGKTIHCDGRDVNASIYSLSVGTYTFIGKKNTPHYAEMINAFTCQ